MSRPDTGKASVVESSAEATSSGWNTELNLRGWITEMSKSGRVSEADRRLLHILLIEKIVDFSAASELEFMAGEI